MVTLYEDAIKIWVEVGKEVGDVLNYEKVVKAFSHQGLKDMSDPFKKILYLHKLQRHLRLSLRPKYYSNAKIV